MAKEPLTEPGSEGPKSQIIAFWRSLHHVGLLASSDREFVDALKRWAKANGYRVEDVR